MLQLKIPYTTTKIEDVVNVLNDITIKHDENNTRTSTKKAEFYNNGYYENKYGTQHYAFYSDTKTPSTSDYTNGNIYDGNLSIWSEYKADGMGVSFDTTSEYGLITVRMTLTHEHRYAFSMMRAQGSTWYSAKAGYSVRFHNAANNNLQTYFYKGDATPASVALRGWGGSVKVTEPTEAFVTFGVYPTMKDGALANAVVFKVQLVGASVYALNETVYDTNVTDLTKGGTSFAIGWGDADISTTYPLLISGVDNPIFAKDEFEIAETYEEGTALSEIELPEGVDAWKNPSQIVTLGENTYVGLVNSEYYGAESYEVAVAVTGGEKTFATQTVTSGSTATKPTLMPTENGSWNFDFATPITANVDVTWKHTESTTP